nr:RagB/SusD family nutrient uptake outer membrane protein [Portibacter lacus]
MDVVPDNTLTLQDLFKQKEEAWDALAKVYSYLPNIDQTHSSEWIAGDEWLGRLDLNSETGNLRGIRLMRGLQTVSDPLLGFWSGTGGAQPLYAGIRSANIFLENINNVPDMTDEEKKNWSAQVKFLKAYYSFILVQHYGPIVIADELIPPDASKDVLFQNRSSVDECFDYIVNLIDESIPDLKEKSSSEEFGQVNQLAAKAIKARVLLFRASPFFNGNNEYFGDFVDKNGSPFFPLNKDNEKWKAALDAVNEAISSCESSGVQLYTYDKEPFPFDASAYNSNNEAMQTLYDLRMVITDPWNEELIWGYSNINIYGQGELAHSSNIRLPEGYGGGVTNTPSYSWQWMGATYRMAERYYTKNGLPIDEDKTYNLERKWDIVITPGVEDSTYKSLDGYMQPGSETINLYLNREPRFYANLGITGGYWRSHGVRINTMMYGGSDGGYNSSQHSTDFIATGIGVKKFVHPESKSGAWQRTIKFPYPIIRMADLYLMKAEILNEYNGGPSQEAYDAINKVRRRAGIPDVEAVWSNNDLVNTLNKHTTQEGFRDIVLQERGIELAFEGQRFWDMIRTKRAVSEFSSAVWGWTHTGETGSSFFNLELKQQRKFSITENLWPIDLNEINTNSNLVQNPGW